jgi:PAS domain S-box-containing protein
VFSKEGKLVLWNKNMEETLWYSAEELSGKDIYDFIGESTLDLNVEAVNKILQKKGNSRWNIV